MFAGPSVPRIAFCSSNVMFSKARPKRAAACRMRGEGGTSYDDKLLHRALRARQAELWGGFHDWERQVDVERARNVQLQRSRKRMAPPKPEAASSQDTFALANAVMAAAVFCAFCLFLYLDHLPRYSP